jgi:hypothetical protein
MSQGLISMASLEKPSSLELTQRLTLLPEHLYKPLEALGLGSYGASESSVV